MTKEQKTEAFIISRVCATVGMNVSERQSATFALIIDAVRNKGIEFCMRDSAEIMSVINANYPTPPDGGTY